MRVLGLLALVLSFPVLAVSRITTQVHDIDYGRHAGEEILVLLKSGHVAKISPHNKSMIDDIVGLKNKESHYTFTLDDQRFITEFHETATPHVPQFDETDLLNVQNKSNYVPTTIADMETAQKYHKEGRRTTKAETQCFNRAMVWTYEWWKKHSLKSMKILIFFTRNYIRRYNFEWWFHIAPYIHVMDEGKVVERVMDLKYTSRPHTFRQWTDIFMRNNVECPVITKYSEYADFPYTGECYIIRTNMYTYQPADLQMNEAWGYTKTSFIMEEVKGAYLEAFDINL